jgi:hypothetical protein
MTKPTCLAEDGCSNVQFRKGLCNRHYRQSLGKTCSECPSTLVVAQGLCSAHYTRKQRHGDVHATSFVKGDDEARFWSHVTRLGDDECWPWTAYVDGKGYGIFKVAGENWPVHRWAYHHFVAPVPDEMTIDHVKDKGCTRKDCVNFLAHLEVVTRAENTMRGGGAGAVNARKTHCIRGHEFTPSNTLIRKGGGRTCRTCKRLRQNRTS